MNTFHKDNTAPEKDEIFVFGSNLSGIHGAGAAAYALRIGAKWGQGIGLYGKTYAIPTKDENIQTMLLSAIRPHIKAFVQFTIDNPDKRFFVTRVGCGLAGFKDNQIAPLFKGAINCSFADEWKKYL